MILDEPAIHRARQIAKRPAFPELSREAQRSAHEPAVPGKTDARIARVQREKAVPSHNGALAVPHRKVGHGGFEKLRMVVIVIVELLEYVAGGAGDSNIQLGA